MATSQDYIDFVVEQIHGFEHVRYKKMFGEYMVYVNEKPILLICDNTVFVKKLDCIEEKMKEALTGFPYDGAKEHYILDIEDTEMVEQVIPILEKVTLPPKLKVKK